MTKLSKTIECLDCHKEAKLYLFPHSLAGIWECDHCGVSDTCEHKEFHAEFTADDGIVSICDECDVMLDEDAVQLPRVYVMPGACYVH